MEVKSTYKYARVSAKKARDVAREIQGLPVSSALDALNFTPKKSGYSSETLFSFNISGGIKRQITKQLGLRFGLTLLATTVNSRSAVFCSGGCTIRFQGDIFAQYEANMGLIFKF